MNFQRTNTKISLLEDFYSHFDEDHRLDTRHGFLEFNTNIFYIDEYISKYNIKTVLDLGAGTGKYSLYLKNKGLEITSVELTSVNIKKMKEKDPSLNIIQLDARDLSVLKDNSFDMILNFGPLYHLLTKEDKLQVLKECKRILKDGGILFNSFLMNEYAITAYGFLKGNIKEVIKEGRIDENYHFIAKNEDIYSYLRLEDIDELIKESDLKLIENISSDSIFNLLRVDLNKMNEETYQELLKYNISISKRSDLIGWSSHVLNIVKK